VTAPTAPITDDYRMTKVEGAAGEAELPAPPSWRGRVRWLQRRDGRAPLTVELAVIAWLFWLYDVINNLAPTRLAMARRDSENLLSLERSLHINIELSINRWLSSHAVIAFIATYWYFFAHVIVTFALLAWMWWRQPDLYRRLRTPLVFINLIAFAVFWRYPLAPPRMLASLGYQDVVASTHAVISWDSGALVHDADQLAAMPSLHIAWASWSAFALWQLTRRRVLRPLIVLYPLVTAVIVIATGNHWVLDVLAGAATFLLGLGLSELLRRLRTVHRRELARGVPELAPVALEIPPSAPAAISERLAQTSSGPT
jgi:diacylglycerol O-acyltransferase